VRERLGLSVPLGPKGDYCRLKSTSARLLLAFILIASSGLATLQFVVTTITWKWGVASYVVATGMAVAMIGVLVMMDTPLRIPANFAGWLSAALLLALVNNQPKATDYTKEKKARWDHTAKQLVCQQHAVFPRCHTVEFALAMHSLAETIRQLCKP
jgi:hypothetical protein